MILRRDKDTGARAASCTFRLFVEGVSSERILAHTGAIWDNMYEVPADHRWLTSDKRPLYIFALHSHLSPFQPLCDHVTNVLSRIEPVCDALKAYREGGALADFSIRSSSTETIRTLELSTEELQRIASVSDTLGIHALSLDEDAIPQNG